MICEDYGKPFEEKQCEKKALYRIQWQGQNEVEQINVCEKHRSIWAEVDTK